MDSAGTLTDLSKETKTKLSHHSLPNGQKVIFDIPSNVTSLTKGAFNEVLSNSRIDITLHLNEGLEKIEDYAFYQCNLSAVTFPKSLTTIGKEAFSSNSNLSVVGIPADGNLTTIGAAAFQYCNITSDLTFPKSLTTIEGSAFSHNESLTSVSFPADGNLTTLGNEAFDFCDIQPSVTFPKSLTKIGWGTFGANKNLTSITFPEDSQLTEIGRNAFNSCNIPKVDFPKSLIRIEQNAFSGNSNLTSITFPEDSQLTYIGIGAFAYCNLPSVTFPKTLERIGMSAFRWNRNLKSISFSKDSELKAIHAGAFYECDLQELDLSNTKVATIGDGAFYKNTSIEPITFPATLEQIGWNAVGDDKGAFEDCNITTLDFSHITSFKEIAKKSFKNNPIHTLSFPKYFHDIEQYAFFDTHLKTVKIYGVSWNVENFKNDYTNFPDGWKQGDKKVALYYFNKQDQITATEKNSKYFRVNPVYPNLKLIDEKGKPYNHVFTIKLKKYASYGEGITLKSNDPGFEDAFKIGDIITIERDERTPDYIFADFGNGNYKKLADPGKEITFTLDKDTTVEVPYPEGTVGANVGYRALNIKLLNSKDPNPPKKEEPTSPVLPGPDPEEPKPTPEKPKPTPEDPKPTPEDPKPTPEDPKPTPDKPVEVPDADIPTYSMTELPDPADSKSPEVIYVTDEDGTPKVYTKTVTDDGDPIYVDEDGTPLTNYRKDEIPKTGQSYLLPIFLITVSGMAVIGMIWTKSFDRQRMK